MTSVLERRARAVEISISTQDVLRNEDELTTSRSSVSSGEVWFAHSPVALWGGRRVWVPELARRVSDLAALRSGWDSLGADALRPIAVAAVTEALLYLDDYIQSAPSVSIRDDGGILCAWSNGYCSVDLDADQDGLLTIYFQDHIAHTDWEGALDGALNVEKWLWQASALNG